MARAAGLHIPVANLLRFRRRGAKGARITRPERRPQGKKKKTKATPRLHPPGSISAASGIQTAPKRWSNDDECRQGPAHEFLERPGVRPFPPGQSPLGRRRTGPVGAHRRSAPMIEARKLMIVEPKRRPKGGIDVRFLGPPVPPARPKSEGSRASLRDGRFTIRSGAGK